MRHEHFSEPLIILGRHKNSVLEHTWNDFSPATRPAHYRPGLAQLIFGKQETAAQGTSLSAFLISTGAHAEPGRILSTAPQSRHIPQPHHDLR